MEQDLKEKEAIARINKASEESNISYFGYLRNVTTLATGLLALLVSLKSNEKISTWSTYLFLATIFSLATGIILSMITQYKEVYTNKESLRHLLNSFSKQGYKKTSTDIEDINSPNVYKPPTKFFARTEILSYISLGLAFIMLIAYVFFVELTGR